MSKVFCTNPLCKNEFHLFYSRKHPPPLRFFLLDRLQVQDIQQILPDFVSLDESTNTIQLNIPWIQQGRYVTGTTYSCGLPDEDGSPNSTYSFNEYVYVLDGPDHFPVTDSLHILNKIICDFATFCILNQDRNIQMDYAHDKAQSWGSHVALICRHCARIYVRASTLKGGMIQIVVSDEPYQRGCTCSPGGLDGCPMVPIRPSSIQSGMATGAIPTAIADTSRTPLMINDFPHDITNTLVLQRLIPYYPEIVMDNTCDSTTIVKWLEDLRETYNLSHSKRWPRDFYTRWRKKESYPRITSTATLVGNYECLSGTSSSRPKLHRNLDQAMVEESRGAEEVNDPEAILAVLSTTGKHDVAAQTTVDEDETRASSQKGIEKAGHFTTAEAATSSEQEGNQRPVDGRNDDDDDDDDDPPSKMVRLEDGEDEEEDTTTASGKEEKGIACEKEEGGEENARDQVLQLKEVVSRLEKQLWDQQAANEALTSRVSEVELQLESERRAHLQKSEDLQAALSAVTTLEVELNALASAASPDNDLDTAVRQEEEEAAAARGQEDEENRRRRQNLMARRRKFEKVMTKSLKDAARDAYKDKDVESRSRTRSVGATYSVLRSGVVTMKPPAGKDPDRDIAAKFMDFLISKPCLSYMEQMIKKKLYPSPEDDETGFEAIRKIQGDRIELSFKKGNCDAALHLLNIFYKSNRIRMPGGDLSSLEYYRDKGPIGTVLKMIYNQFQNVPKRHLYIELAESSDELQVSLIISKEDAKAQTVHLDAEDGNSNSITNFNPGSGTLLYDVATDHEFKVSGVDSSVIVDRFQTVLETNLQNVSLSPSTLELMHESDEIKTSLEKKGDVVVVQICGPGKFQRTSEKNERWTTTLMSSTQLHAGPPSALPRIAGYCPHKNIGSNGQEYGGETQSSAVLIILYICLDIWTANEGPDGEPGIASRLWPAGDVDANLKIARRDILRVLWEVIKTDDLQNWSDNIQSNDRVATMMRTMENSKETNFSEEEVSGMIESWASCDDMFGW